MRNKGQHLDNGRFVGAVGPSNETVADEDDPLVRFQFDHCRSIKKRKEDDENGGQKF